MRRAGLGVIAITGATFLLAGCGSSHSVADARRGEALVGQRLFAGACGGCHTIVGRNTRSSGGDLGGEHLSVPDLESFTRVMPVRPPLTSAQVRAVAAYVSERQRTLAVP